MTLNDLSNDELLARLRSHVGRGNVWLVGLLAYLGEVDARRLYAEQACSSTWDFCVRRLRMSEGEAIRRIAAARVLRRFPVARGYVLRGELHLSGIYEIHKHLTPDNHQELLREAAGKSTKAVAELIAAQFPRPDVHPCIEPLALQPALPLAQAQALAGSIAAAAAVRPEANAALSPNPTTAASTPSPGTLRAQVEPLSATRYRVALTVSTETKRKLERIRDLMLHRNPTGDLERIFDVALTLLLAKLEKERLGKRARSQGTKRSTSSAAGPLSAPSNQRLGAAPARHVAARDVLAVAAWRPSLATPVRGERSAEEQAEPAACAMEESVHVPGSVPKEEGKPTLSPTDESIDHRDPPAPTRSASASVERAKTATENVRKVEASAPTKKRRRDIPRAIRRAVFARDGEQCTFTDSNGNRCPERGYLELDHVESWALGGSDTASNLRVRCGAHNLWHAAQVFGRAHVDERIHVRRQGSTARSAPSFDASARGLRSLGFREPEVRAAMAQLQAKLEPSTPAETVLREALRILT